MKEMMMFPLFLFLLLVGLNILRLTNGVQFYEIEFNSSGEVQLERNSGCTLYLSYSLKSGAGRGIYAGVDFAVDDMVGDFNPSIIVPRSKLLDTSLIYYDYDAGDTEAELGLVLLGPGAIFNHDFRPSVTHVWTNPKDLSPKDTEREFPSSALFFDAFIANKPIKQGEEIYNSYGQAWFKLNKMKAVDGDKRNLELESSNEAIPAVCLSDILVGPSSYDSYLSPTFNISLGYGVFAQRRFQKGELITVAQLLFLPRSIIKNLPVNESEILNYVYDVEGTELMLLPLGMAAIMNHYRRLFRDVDDAIFIDGNDESRVSLEETEMEQVSEVESPNVFVEWFDWWEHFPCKSENDSSTESPCRYPQGNQPRHLQDILSLSSEELIAQNLAVADLGYYASRDISEGEELFLDYGEGFENYVQDMLDEHNRRMEANDMEPIILRHGLEFPSHLIPDHWLKEEVSGLFSETVSHEL